MIKRFFLNSRFFVLFIIVVLSHGFPAQSAQVSARIKSVTCVMSLTLDIPGSEIMWNVGLITRSDNTSSVVGGAEILKRKVVIVFSNPDLNQLDPVSGGKVECTKAKGGLSLLFKAKDSPISGDLSAGAIPDVNTGDHYFEYFVTYRTNELKNATSGMATTIIPPSSGKQYKGEDVMPLSGNQLSDLLKIKFTGDGILGQYPFYIWLVDEYRNPATAPIIQTTVNKYSSSLTITATYL